jgi:hypothetical protein
LVGERAVWRCVERDRSKKPQYLHRDYSPGIASKRALRAKIEKAAHAFAEREAREAGLID